MIEVANNIKYILLNIEERTYEINSGGKSRIEIWIGRWHYFKKKCIFD
jgi:hypothetical protein